MTFAWNLFLKDQRVLRWWLLAWVGASLMLAGFAYLDWASSQSSANRSVLWKPLWVLIGALTVVQLVHQEPIGKGLSFWKTRPMRPRHLLLGKLAFLLVYFVAVPFLILSGLLHFTLGDTESVRVGQVEWAARYFPLGLAILAVATLTSRLYQVFIAWFGIIVAFLAVRALVETVTEPDYGERLRWVDFPSLAVMEAFVLGVLAMLVVVAQYAFGWRRVSLALAIGALVAMASMERVLPLHRYPYRGPDAFPESTETLERVADDWAAELDRVCPLEERWFPIGEKQDGSRYVILQPALPSGPYQVIQSRSSLEYGGQTYHSTMANLRSNGFPYLRQTLLAEAAGITEISERHVGWHPQRMLRLDEAIYRGFPRGIEGTLRTEVLFASLEPSLLVNLPLEEGAEVRHGPYRLHIDEVKPSVDSIFFDISEEFVWSQFTRVDLAYPRRSLQDEGALKLYHRPTETLISLDESSQEGDRRVGPWRRERHRFSMLHGMSSVYAYFRDCLLHEANLNVKEWALVGGHQAVQATTTIPVVIPNLRLNRQVPTSEEELIASLAAIQRDPAAPTETYLWELMGCWSRDRGRSSLKHVGARLEALESSDVPALITVGRRLTGPYWEGASNLVAEHICRLAAPEHRELIVANIDIDFDLLPAIRAHGWEKEALPRMMAKVKGEVQYRIPKAWDELFLESGVEDVAFLTELAVRRLGEEAFLERIPSLKQVPLAAVTERRWQATVGFGFGGDFFDSLEEQLRYGNPLALTRLLYVLRSGLRGQDDPDPMTLVSLLSTMSTCPSEKDEAITWLEAHAKKTTFDRLTQRYESPSNA